MGPPRLAKGVHFIPAVAKGGKEHAKSTLQPWICSHETGEILGISEGTPILRNEWIRYLQDGRIVSVAETHLTVNAVVRKFEQGGV